jgi:CDP-diacylglycerol--serine O-phosphatidyltransferase
MHIQRLIPNTFTMLNLFSGILALLCIQNENFWGGFLFMLVGIGFDFFDGFFARMFKLTGPLGIQLDSLADAVTSGIVPGFIMYKLIENTLGTDNTLFFSSNEFSIAQLQSVIPFFGFLITIAAVYRLAKFNISKDQKHYFIGLPTPANAIFIASLALFITDNQFTVLNYIDTPWFLLIITLLSCFIMNSKLLLLALKFKSYDFKSNKVRYLFIASTILMVSLIGINAVPLTVILYILFSLPANIKFK